MCGNAAGSNANAEWPNATDLGKTISSDEWKMLILLAPLWKQASTLKIQVIVL